MRWDLAPLYNDEGIYMKVFDAKEFGSTLKTRRNELAAEGAKEISEKILLSNVSTIGEA